MISCHSSELYAAGHADGLACSARYEDVVAFDRTLTVNLRAPFLLARRSLPGMRERGFGRVGHPGEVADLALAILRNGCVTSQGFSIDGGMHPR